MKEKQESVVDESTPVERAPELSDEEVAEIVNDETEIVDRHEIVDTAMMETMGSMENLVTGEVLYIMTEILRALAEQTNIPLIDCLTHIYLGGASVTTPSEELLNFTTEKFNGYPAVDVDKNLLLIVSGNRIVFTVNIDDGTVLLNESTDVPGETEEFSKKLLSLSDKFIEESKQSIDELRRTTLVPTITDPVEDEIDGSPETQS